MDTIPSNYFMIFIYYSVQSSVGNKFKFPPKIVFKLLNLPLSDLRHGFPQWNLLSQETL